MTWPAAEIFETIVVLVCMMGRAKFDTLAFEIGS